MIRIEIISMIRAIRRWFISNLTIKGRREKYYKKAFNHLDELDTNRKLNAKLKVVHSSGRILKVRKILGFCKGKGSISKVSTNKGELRTKLSGMHKRELRSSGLTISKDLKFKDA